jgi:hypothetical protein
MDEIGIFAGVPGITPLTIGDEALFRSLVRSFRSPDNMNFEDSWAYILQATRVCPAKFHSGDFFAALTLKQDRSAIVIPNYFSPSFRLVGEFASFLARTLRLPVILKNVGTEDAPALTAIGFKPYGKDERWDESSKYDDQTFPQAVIDLGRVVSARGRSYEDLRCELHKCPPLSFRHYRIEYDYGVVEEMLLYRDRCMRGVAYDAEIHFLEMESGPNMIALVFFLEKKLVGFSLSDRISGSCIAFNSMIRDYSIRGLFTRLAYETAKVAKERGYRFGNLQGAETEGLHGWKRKFRPCREIHKTHLVYRA